MANNPWEISPYVIGVAQFPDESGPEWFVLSPNGKIVSYHFSYNEAYEEAMRLKNALKG